MGLPEEDIDLLFQYCPSDEVTDEVDVECIEALHEENFDEKDQGHHDRDEREGG